MILIYAAFPHPNLCPSYRAAEGLEMHSWERVYLNCGLFKKSGKEERVLPIHHELTGGMSQN